jgi:hypothetical protein
VPLPEVSLPFRWDLIAPDQLGSMAAALVRPDPWFVPALAGCAGKVLARGAGGDLYFVGRSLDSMFDLLSGALDGLVTDIRLARLPLSFQRPQARTGGRGWQRPTLPAGQRDAARGILAGQGVTPATLARRTRPVTFVDVVFGGRTFTDLFGLLDDWVRDEREFWAVVRRKLRFVGVTSRQKTSPKAWRWQQHAPWTRRLPAGAVVNVSLDPWVWSYFGDSQTKLTGSFTPDRWLSDPGGPARDAKVRDALAEAVALVAFGRSAEGRRMIARAVDGEPALAEPWLRSLVRQLNGGR